MKQLLTSSIFLSPSVVNRSRPNNGLLLSREESSTTACPKLRSVSLFPHFTPVKKYMTFPSVKAQTVHVDLDVSSLSPAYQTASWVNFFFWIFIGALLIFQRRQSSRSKMMAGGLSGPVGSLFGDPGVTAAETEPFFNRPARPQWGRAEDEREQCILCRKLWRASIYGLKKSDFAVQYF